jgi:hypothetical protein
LGIKLQDPDWGFFLPWLRFFYSDWGFFYPDWGFITLTEIFPCFFLSRKANARVKLAKRGTVRILPY